MIQGGNHTIRWDDLRFPATTVKAGAINPPTDVAYKDGLVLSFAKNVNNKIYFIAQMPHQRQHGSNIEFHVHYVLKTPGAGLGTENVKFNFTYSWANIMGTFPTATAVSSTKDVGMYQTADTHILQDVVETIDGADKSLSSMLVCSLERDVIVADNYDDEVYFLEADFHYQIDSNGSRQKTVK